MIWSTFNTCLLDNVLPIHEVNDNNYNYSNNNDNDNNDDNNILIFILIIKGIVQWTFHKLALLLLQLLPKVRVLKNKTQEKLLVNLTAPLHVQYSSACNKYKSHFNLTT